MAPASRGISPAFRKDLLRGVLSPVLERSRVDGSIDLEVRDARINLYYRGLNALEVAEVRPHTYEFRFDTGYAKAPLARLAAIRSATPVTSLAECKAWLENLALVKDAIDCYCGSVRDAREKEVQQALVRDNNRPSTGRGTDYYICDVEHARTGHGFRFDAVAVRWPSRGHERKKGINLRLAIIEVKFGESALRDSRNAAGDVTSPGLAAHAADVDRFASLPDLESLKRDMVRVFRQRWRLGLIDCAKPFASFSRENPELIFVLADQDPDSPILEEELARLPATSSVEVYVARANNFGHALYAEQVKPLAEFVVARGRRAARSATATSAEAVS